MPGLTDGKREVEEEGMWVGDGLLFHPQLSSEPSKLIAGQLVCMLNYCSLQKKKKVFVTANQTSCQKVVVSLLGFNRMW